MTMTDPVGHLRAAALLDRMYVNGEWRPPEGAEIAAVTDPATERTVAEVVLGSRADVDLAVAAARAAFPGWAATDREERARYLFAIRELIMERAELFAQAISLEMGSAITFARASQVPLAAEHIRVAAENLATYPFLEMQGSTAIAREPIGVCGLITPWNWPLYQITAKVAPALAAGCTVILKPSELSPLNALLFAQVIEDAGVPAGVFNLVNGDRTRSWRRDVASSGNRHDLAHRLHPRGRSSLAGGRARRSSALRWNWAASRRTLSCPMPTSIARSRPVSARACAMSASPAAHPRG